MDLIKVCDVTDVAPGEMLAVEHNDLPPVAVYNVEGSFFVTSNICTHAIAILTEGYLDGEIIECPLHGGTFNVKTGEAIEFPCEEDLKTYLVEVRGDEVFVQAN